MDTPPGARRLVGTAQHSSWRRKERASFGHAFAGVGYTWKTQRHLRVHVVVAGLAILAGLWLSLSAPEWAVLLATIAFVITLEFLNTVVEVVVDLVTPAYHPLAKVAKDVAAGAVLVATAGAVAVGVALYTPHLWALVRP